MRVRLRHTRKLPVGTSLYVYTNLSMYENQLADKL